jgi:hypothetical protein
MGNTYISLKSKKNFKGKKDRNETIKAVAAEMGMKKSAKMINWGNFNGSHSSIKETVGKTQKSPSFALNA